MGLLIREDPYYDESVRQVGFNRYKQLMSKCFGRWWKANLITLLGMAPLAVGIWYAVAASSTLVLLPCSILGGMIAGPFLAGMYDAVLRGLRDDPLPWREAWVRAWKQNWKASLIPGALMGLMAGLYSFMVMLFSWAETAPSPGTVALYLSSLLLLLMLCSLYWPQLVLFEQSPAVRLRNCVLFCIQHFWRVMGVGLLQLVYIFFCVLLPILLLITGAWYIVFLAQFLIYNQLDAALHIEEQYDAADE